MGWDNSKARLKETLAFLADILGKRRYSYIGNDLKRLLEIFSYIRPRCLSRNHLHYNAPQAPDIGLINDLDVFDDLRRHIR